MRPLRRLLSLCPPLARARRGWHRQVLDISGLSHQDFRSREPVRAGCRVDGGMCDARPHALASHLSTRTQIRLRHQWHLQCWHLQPWPQVRCQLGLHQASFRSHGHKWRRCSGCSRRGTAQGRTYVTASLCMTTRMVMCKARPLYQLPDWCDPYFAQNSPH